MITQDEIREDIEDAPHPDEVNEDERLDAFMPYTARMLYEAGQDSDEIAAALKDIETDRSQISASIAINDALEAEAPEVDEEIEDLALSGAYFIRAARNANAALHGIPDGQEHS